MLTIRITRLPVAVRLLLIARMIRFFGPVIVMAALLDRSRSSSANFEFKFRPVALLLGLAFLLVWVMPSDQRDPVPTPTVAITFDEYRTTFDVAFPIMERHGLVGTYYVDPRQIDIEGGIASSEIRQMQDAGWEIGLYSVQNIHSLVGQEGPSAARAWLSNIKSMMLEKGFEIASLAAAQRAWGSEERDIAEGQFANVRVVDHFEVQQYPIADWLHVKAGGTASLSASDSLSEMAVRLDQVIEQSSLWTVVVHRVSDDGDPIYTVSPEFFESMIAMISAKAKLGQLRVTTFSKAIAVE